MTDSSGQHGFTARIPTNQIHLAAAIVGSGDAGQPVGLVNVDPLPPFLGVQPATVPTARQSVRGAAVGLPASVQEAHGSIFRNRSTLGLVLPFFSS